MSNAYCCLKYRYEGEHEPTCVCVTAAKSNPNASEPKAETERRMISDEQKRAFAKKLESLQADYAKLKDKPPA